MKTYTVIVELEVKILATSPRQVDQVLADATWEASVHKTARTPSELRPGHRVHIERVLKTSQYHHER